LAPPGTVTAVELTIRPNRHRHVKPAVTLAIVLGLVLLAMGLVPAVALGTLTVLNVRNMALRTDQGRLVSI
jgi:hypothetical protein